jgi:hypothetical protein
MPPISQGLELTRLITLALSDASAPKQATVGCDLAPPAIMLQAGEHAKTHLIDMDSR